MLEGPAGIAMARYADLAVRLPVESVKSRIGLIAGGHSASHTAAAPSRGPRGVAAADPPVAVGALSVGSLCGIRSNPRDTISWAHPHDQRDTDPPWAVVVQEPGGRRERVQSYPDVAESGARHER